MPQDKFDVLPIVDLQSKWVDSSLMRATVKKYKGTFVIQIMELTAEQTCERRCKAFAIKVARDQRGIASVDSVTISSVVTERKAERLDGSLTVTHIRTQTFAFSGV